MKEDVVWGVIVICEYIRLIYMLSKYIYIGVCNCISIKYCKYLEHIYKNWNVSSSLLLVHTYIYKVHAIVYYV